MGNKAENIMVCEVCNKNKKKLDFTDRKTNTKMCWICAFKHQLEIDKNFIKTLNKFINYATFRTRHRIYDGIDKIMIAILTIYLIACTFNNLNDFDLLNLSMVVFIYFLIKEEF
ncbi:MAG: hypothetical protein ACRCXT_03315 [Paraclostridium sp.]